MEWSHTGQQRKDTLPRTYRLRSALLQFGGEGSGVRSRLRALGGGGAVGWLQGMPAGLLPLSWLAEGSAGSPLTPLTSP